MKDLLKSLIGKFCTYYRKDIDGDNYGWAGELLDYDRNYLKGCALTSVSGSSTGVSLMLSSRETTGRSSMSRSIQVLRGMMMTTKAWIRVCGYHRKMIEHTGEDEKGPTTVLCQAREEEQCPNRASYDILAVFRDAEQKSDGQ